MTNPRQTISEILVKWDMPTRQAAINELVQLIEATVLKVIGEDMPTPSGPRAAGKTYAIVANRTKTGQRARLAQLLGREKEK